MAITASGLKSKIVADIKSAYSGATPVAPIMYLQSIKDYIEANAEVTYTYVGNLTVYPFSPDPVSGTAKAKLMLPALPAGAAVKAFLKGVTKQADPDGFIKAIMTDALGTVVLQTPHVGSLPTIYTSISSVESSLAKKDNMEDCWAVIAKAIVDSFLSFKVPSIPTTTASPGAGVSTFVSIR